MCGTAPLQEALSQDLKLLHAAKEKQKQNPVLRKKPEKQAKSQEKVESQTEVSVFSTAALSTFKMSRKRMSAISARSGIADKRPPQEDKNMWKTLLESHRGHTYSVRVLARIISLLRKRGSVSHSGPAGLSPHQKAMWTLFAAERVNSYHAFENRRGTPSFKIEEVSNILFLCGRKITED